MKPIEFLKRNKIDNLLIALVEEALAEIGIYCENNKTYFLKENMPYYDEHGIYSEYDFYEHGGAVYDCYKRMKKHLGISKRIDIDYFDMFGSCLKISNMETGRSVMLLTTARGRDIFTRTTFIISVD